MPDALSTLQRRPAKWIRTLRLAAALFAVAASLWVLESARSGVEITQRFVGETPVIRYALPDADGPLVVVAHGFAGSARMMQGYALPLAQAGYRVDAFDFLGHGQHPRPMSGDVASPDGTTRLLVEQTNAVITGASKLPATDVALLGHSMATDLLVRVAQANATVGPMVLLSAFSREIDGRTPEDLILITGAWEPGLREFALEAEAMAASENDAVRRAAVIAPLTDHVSILHSRSARRAALDWLDSSYGRSSNVTILATGHALLVLVAGLVVLLKEIARLLPRRDVAPDSLSRRQIAIAALLPASVTPPLAVLITPQILPILVADYIAVHLAIYGAIQLMLLRYWRVPLGGISWSAVGFVLFGSFLIGVALHRYGANFVPVAERLWIVGLMAFGAVLFFLADARLAHRTRFRRRAALHGTFLLSLVFAVALDFEGLFFVVMILPVIVLFFLVFGTLGHAASNRGGPVAVGLALGFVLAWALGVSFPLFSA